MKLDTKVAPNQLIAPAILMSAVPPSVAAESDRLATFTTAALLKLPVALPFIVRLPIDVLAPLKVVVPPAIWVVATLYVPAIVVVLPTKRAVPAPLMLEVAARFCPAPANVRVAPDATL